MNIGFILSENIFKAISQNSRYEKAEIKKELIKRKDVKHQTDGIKHPVFDSKHILRHLWRWLKNQLWKYYSGQRFSMSGTGEQRKLSQAVSPHFKM